MTAMFASKKSLERKLISVSDELAKVTEELRLSEQQTRFFDEQSEDARLRSIVSESPLAQSEYKDVLKSTITARKTQESLSRRKDKLQQKQDTLLDDLSRITRKSS